MLTSRVSGLKIEAPLCFPAQQRTTCFFDNQLPLAGEDQHRLLNPIDTSSMCELWWLGSLRNHMRAAPSVAVLRCGWINISIPYRIYAAIYLYYVGQLISNDILCGPGRLLVRRSSFTLPLSVTSATVHERVQAPAQALKFQASCTNLSLLQDSETLLTANLSDRDHSWQNCIPISLDFIAS